MAFSLPLDADLWERFLENRHIVASRENRDRSKREPRGRLRISLQFNQPAMVITNDGGVSCVVAAGEAWDEMPTRIAGPSS